MKIIILFIIVIIVLSGCITSNQTNQQSFFAIINSDYDTLLEKAKAIKKQTGLGYSCLDLEKPICFIGNIYGIDQIMDNATISKRGDDS